MNLVIQNFKNNSNSLLEKYFTGRSFDYKQIFAILIPLCVDQAFLILMTFINTAMISSSGAAAVSAVSMVDSLNIFLIGMFIALSTGGTVIIAQYKGNGNKEMVSKTATQALSVVTITSVLISILIIVFHTVILTFLFGKAEADVLENAKIYLIGSAISYPLFAIFQAVSGSLRGIGETKPVLRLSLLMNITNTVLNVLFIIILDMGMMGLVISIILARLLGMFSSLFYIIKHNETIHFKIKNAILPDLPIIRKVLYIGIPFAIEQVFFSGGKLLVQTYVIELGTLALTAYAIANAIVLLFQIVPNAISIGIVTVVGQCIGRRNIEDAKKFTKSLNGLSSILFLITSMICLPFFPLMMKLFKAPDDIISTIFILVIMSAIAQPFFFPKSFSLPAALRAAGDANFTTVASLLSMWLVRVVLGYVLGITLGFGIIGVWSAMLIEWVVRGTIFTIRFKGQKWYAHKLI